MSCLALQRIRAEDVHVCQVGVVSLDGPVSHRRVIDACGLAVAASLLAVRRRKTGHGSTPIWQRSRVGLWRDADAFKSVFSLEGVVGRRPELLNSKLDEAGQPIAGSYPLSGLY
jgi:hypothetical protein